MDIKALVAQMTLEEKAGMCSGLDFWHTKPVERLGIPSVMVSDGPHGLRKQAAAADHLGINGDQLDGFFHHVFLVSVSESTAALVQNRISR